MAYLQHNSWKDRPGAVMGVVGIHALIGYALVTGLTFERFVKVLPPLEGYEVEVELPPPPQPEDPVEPETSIVERPVVVPISPLDITDNKPLIDSTDVILPNDEIITKIIPQPTPAYTPAASPTFDPVGARPKGNPGAWVTVNDYRSSWINREMAGTARFRLAVGADGRVENCTITDSSGHSELDKATCALVTQRAKFEPAKDGTGAKVTGSYSNSVRWELPE